MRNLLTAVLAVVSLGLFSCQKEVTDVFAGSGNNGGGSNGLLTKITAKTGSDSTEMLFTYNSSKKLVGLVTNMVSSGTTTTVIERAERNAQGIIQRVIYKSDSYQQLGLDSAIAVIKYVGGRYTTEVTEFDVGGIIFSDSIALSYDGAGKVIREDEYFVFLGSADVVGKTEYTYSGNNIATIKTYSWDGSAYNLEITDTYDQYDNKVNPMYFGNEAFVFGSPVFYSTNNPVKSSQSDGTTTLTFTTSYNYNSSNKPVTAQSVTQPGGEVQTGNYYYQ